MNARAPWKVNLRSRDEIDAAGGQMRCQRSVAMMKRDKRTPPAALQPFDQAHRREVTASDFLTLKRKEDHPFVASHPVSPPKTRRGQLAIARTVSCQGKSSRQGARGVKRPNTAQAETLSARGQRCTLGHPEGPAA